jgi:DNA repair exonuclease SbcCD ATPase subunit
MRVEITNSQKVFSKVDLEHYIQDLKQRSNEEEDFGNEMQILQNALDFSKIRARDCMVPRPEIICLEVDDSIENLSNLFVSKGISKVIIKNMIPLLNQELYRLLSDSCYFTLELNINDKNELEFLMIDNETRVVKPLSSGSGYERTISSLAIRSVLTKISSLPKPNIVVMDEVFGKIADDNLEMVGEFFKKIKNYFEHILVISHNPLIRNWSDNIIMVKKDDNISSVEFITTKIS